MSDYPSPQQLPLCEQQEREARIERREDEAERQARFGEREPWNPVEYWAGAGQDAWEHYRDERGSKVVAVGRLYHAMKELASLARRDTTEAELHAAVEDTLDDAGKP